MARPAKPLEQRRRTGRSPGRDSGGRTLPAGVVELVPSAQIPAPPASLGERGRATWTRLWTAGQSWLCPQTDLDVMTRLCEAHDERLALQGEIAARGYTVEGYMGQPRPNPVLTQLRIVERQLTVWESSCGFNPSDRARMGVAVASNDASELEQIFARRAPARVAAAVPGRAAPRARAVGSEQD